MKSAVSSLVSSSSSKIHLNFNLNLRRRNHLYSPFFRADSIFLRKAKPIFQSPPLIRTHSSNPNPIMASSFKPEQARAPPALPLPTPPVTKAISHFAFLLSYFLNLDDGYLYYAVVLVFSFIYLFISFSLRLGFANCQ